MESSSSEQIPCKYAYFYLKIFIDLWHDRFTRARQDVNSGLDFSASPNSRDDENITTSAFQPLSAIKVSRGACMP